MTVTANDTTLMRLIAAGDEDAFRRLTERHLARMLRLARRMTGDNAEAEDLAQEALLRIWLHADRWQPERSALTTWIYTIVYRLCLDKLRAPRTASLEPDTEIPDPAPDALAGLSRHDDLQRLSQALARLPPRQRAALTLFYYEDLPGPEAAAVLGLTLRAFWSLLHRARQSAQTLISDNPVTAQRTDP